MKRSSLILISFIAAAVIGGLVYFYNAAKITNPTVLQQAKKVTGIIPHRIAHAGGGFNKVNYTNSYDALDYNYDQGFLYFELDFVFTSDNQLVCLHDWKSNFKRTFGFETTKKYSLVEFERLVEDNTKFKNCTLKGLADWMIEHPLATIITDVKEKNIVALRDIYSTLPNARQRVIPQVYQPENFETIKAIGYQQIIWTLYRYRGGNESVLTALDTFSGPIAIAMPKKRASSNLPTRLAERNIPTYVHTINRPSDVNKYKNTYKISEIYTDYLIPTR